MKMRALSLACLLSTLSLAAACTPDPPSETDSEEAPAASSLTADAPSPTPAVEAALAVLRPASGSDARGTVRFETRPAGGISVTAEMSGLEPGTHAFHVHRNGDCTAGDASSAGSHFPFVETGDEPDFITGNLGEMVAGDGGTATVARDLPTLELDGPRAVVGRAVVVHRAGNDTTAAPTGDTGTRVACGVIGVTG